MRRAGVDEAVIEDVLAQLRAHQLLDDRAFAEYWVEQRQTHRPRGARLLRAELARLGVERATADLATAATQETADESAYRVGAQRARQLRGLPDGVLEARLSAFLIRRGFDWETVSTVVRRLSAEYVSTSSSSARAPMA